MARTTKVGIDYFSHDVDMLQDKKIKLIKAKHGLIGYAVYLRLLEELYRSNGYYLQVDEDFDILFSDDNNINYDVYISILNDCINKNLFDKSMFDKYRILTSCRIQGNYCSATERRKEVYFVKEYLLIDVRSKYNEEKVNVYIEPLIVDINSLNTDIGTQSKGKEIKGDKRKNTSHFVPPTYDDVLEYCKSRDNSVDPEKFIDFYESKGWLVGKVKMKDWKASIRTWEKSSNQNNSRKVVEL